MALALVAAVGGCDRIGTEPSDAGSVSLSLISGTAAGGAADRAALAATDGTGAALDIDGIQLLLREADLKRVEDDACEEGEDDSCERFEVGPVLVDLPLDGGVVTPFTAPVPAGSYDEIEVRIKEPEDGSGDRARFQAAHPDWPRKATIRVTGTFDGGNGAEAFDIFLPVDARVERDLDPPLVVDAGTDPGSINLTVAVDVESWFRDRDGRLLDPRATTSDSRVLEVVRRNVRDSFRALRDDDRDGHDDHGEKRGHG